MANNSESDILTTMPMCTRNNFQNLYENRTWNSFNRIVDSVVHRSFVRNDASKFDAMSTVVYVHPKLEVEDIQYWIMAAIAFTLVRRLFESKVFIPLGKRLGIKDKPSVKTPPVPFEMSAAAVSLLENVYISSPPKLPNLLINKLSTQTGIDCRQVERWFRKRRALDRPSTLIKFSESGWRFVCYVLSTSLGFFSLRSKPCVWDSSFCWPNYPLQDVTTDIWVYYTYGIGLYISFLMTQAFDVKRKDFWEMVTHHVITVVLLGLAWAFKTAHMALFILLLHDCSDVFLEAAKMANYSKKEGLTTGIFVSFIIVWITTRLIIYPKKILFDSVLQAWEIEQIPRSFICTTVGLLTILFGLHLFWTYHIFKIVKTMLSGNNKQKDSRSSTESGTSSEEDETSKVSDSKEQLY